MNICRFYEKNYGQRSSKNNQKGKNNGKGEHTMVEMKKPWKEKKKLEGTMVDGSDFQHKEREKTLAQGKRKCDGQGEREMVDGKA